MDETMADIPTPANLNRKAELKVDLRPTLFIGAGGTGMEVMMRIRRRILSAVWNRQHPTRVESIADFPVARFLHFDLDNNAVIDEGKSQRTDPWYELVRLTDEERLVEPLDLPQYHESDDSLARFPLIESWMPLRPKKLRSLGIDPSKGAGQIRAVARLYLFDKYPKLRGRIKGALNFLSSNAGIERKENYQRLGLQVDTSKFRIVVIASNAGGTGAGSAIDLGWMAKAIARQEVSDSQVDLVMFMPSGFAKANKERTEANAYATMMELETTMRDMNARVSWMDPDSIQGRGGHRQPGEQGDPGREGRLPDGGRHPVRGFCIGRFRQPQALGRGQPAAAQARPLQSARAGAALRRHAPVLLEGVLGLRAGRARHPAKPARGYPRLRAGGADGEGILRAGRG